MKKIFLVQSALVALISLSIVQAGHVPGKTVTYKGVTVTQPVVAGQQGAMCGYHALLNGMVLFDRLANGIPAVFGNGQAEFGSNVSPWLQFVLARDREYQTGEMIEGDILSQLTQSVFKDINNHYAILDADLNFLDRRNAQYNGTAQNQKKFWDNVRRYIRDTIPCSYMFLVNTSSCSEQLQAALAQGQQALSQGTPGSEIVIEGAEGQAGHWIVVYFHKNAQGVHQYYVADSAQGDYTGSRLVTQIIDRIEDPSPIPAVKPQVMPKPFLSSSSSGASSASAAVGQFDAQVQGLISAAQQEEKEFKATLELSKTQVQTVMRQEEQDVQKAIKQSMLEAEKRLQEQEQSLLEQVRQQSLKEEQQRQQKTQTAARELERQRHQEVLRIKQEQQLRKQEEAQVKAALQASIATAPSVLSEEELLQQAIQESLRIAPKILSEEEQLQQALQESLRQEEAASLAALFSQAWRSSPSSAPRPPVAPRPVQMTQQQQQQAQQQRQETPQEQARRLAAEAAQRRTGKK